MRYGIFADVHSNLEALQAVLEAYRLERIDEYLCVGDVVGYASEPCECLELVRSCARAVVAGNHDWASVGLFPVCSFNTYAATAVVWTQGELDADSRAYLQRLGLVYKTRDLTLVHGSLDAPEEFNYVTDSSAAGETFKRMETDVSFIGHLHVPGVFIEEKGRIRYSSADTAEILPQGRYIINVGSVGQPRDGDPLGRLLYL